MASERWEVVAKCSHDQPPPPRIQRTDSHCPQLPPTASHYLQYGEIFTEFYFKPSMVWVPAHVVTFTVVPQKFRIAWTATVSVGWLSFVSYFANQEDEPAGEGGGSSVT